MGPWGRIAALACAGAAAVGLAASAGPAEAAPPATGSLAPTVPGVPARMPDPFAVMAFENHGNEVGATLPHLHGQIYAFPFVPPKAARMIAMAGAYRHGNLFRDILDAERRAGTRLVATSEHWTAYVPAAARWPVEVHLAPHRDVPDLPALTSADGMALTAGDTVQ